MVQRVVHDALEGIQSTAASAASMAQDKLHRFGKMASDYADAGRAKAGDLAHWTRDEVCERPVQSTLIAIGLGCLIAACFVRR
jgi:ElaB/YqjD/DUF883 family membrane-anchored ribosome-binding protein